MTFKCKFIEICKIYANFDRCVQRQIVTHGCCSWHWTRHRRQRPLRRILLPISSVPGGAGSRCCCCCCCVRRRPSGGGSGGAGRRQPTHLSVDQRMQLRAALIRWNEPRRRRLRRRRRMKRPDSRRTDPIASSRCRRSWTKTWPLSPAP